METILHGTTLEYILSLAVLCLHFRLSEAFLLCVGDDSPLVEVRDLHMWNTIRSCSGRIIDAAWTHPALSAVVLVQLLLFCASIAFAAGLDYIGTIEAFKV